VLGLAIYFFIRWRRGDDDGEGPPPDAERPAASEPEPATEA
jgi:hypothetical protein